MLVPVFVQHMRQVFYPDIRLLSLRDFKIDLPGVIDQLHTLSFLKPESCAAHPSTRKYLQTGQDSAVWILVYRWHWLESLSHQNLAHLDVSCICLGDSCYKHTPLDVTPVGWPTGCNAGRMAHSKQRLSLSCTFITIRGGMHFGVGIFWPLFVVYIIYVSCG